MTVQELARAGTNRACVDCEDAPLFGGMRCLDCFRAKAEQRRRELLTGGGSEPGRYKKVGTHDCAKHQPAVVCYIKCKCRCIECLQVMSDYRKKHPR